TTKPFRSEGDDGFLLGRAMAVMAVHARRSRELVDALAPRPPGGVPVDEQRSGFQMVVAELLGFAADVGFEQARTSGVAEILRARLPIGNDPRSGFWVFLS